MNRVDPGSKAPQGNVPIGQNPDTPISNALNTPHVVVKHGEKISDLTGASLRPKVAPKRGLQRARSFPNIKMREPKKGEENAPQQVRLNETSENNRLLVNEHDIEEAESSIEEANLKADTEKNPGEPESKWEMAKALIKGLWKSDMVRSIVFGAVAALALVGLGFAVTAAPITGGGSLAAYTVGVVALAIIFELSFVAALLSWGGEEPPPLAAGDKPPFPDAYQTAIDDVGNGNTPSYEKFMANPNVRAFLDNEKQSGQINPEAKQGFDALKTQNEEIQKRQDEIKKEQEKRAKILASLQEQIKKVDLAKREGLERLQQQFDTLNPNLSALREQLKQEEAKEEIDAKEILKVKKEIGRIESEVANTDEGKELIKQKEALVQEAQAEIQIYQGRIQSMPAKTENQVRIETEIQSQKEALDNNFKALLQKFDSLEKLCTP